jgi:hypothetical protein
MVLQVGDYFLSTADYSAFPNGMCRSKYRIYKVAEVVGTGFIRYLGDTGEYYRGTAGSNMIPAPRLTQILWAKEIAAAKEKAAT